MKFFKIFIVLLVVFTGLYIYNKNHTLRTDTSTHKPAVALSTFALYDVAKEISGDTLECFLIVPLGVDVHDYEPTPKIMARLHDAKLIVYSGAGLEPWMHPFTNAANVLDMSKHVKLLHLKNKHANNVIDPHYWLDVDNMIIAAKVLRDRFIKMYPKHTKLYERNTARYIAGLKRIDAAYKAQLDSCKKDTIIVGHNAFSYLAKKYNFHVDSISGLAPDAQPSAKVIKQIILDVKKYNISTIFFIPFTNRAVVDSIASETGTKAGILQPIVNITDAELKKNATYNSLMMENLKQISKALECH